MYTDRYSFHMCHWTVLFDVLRNEWNVTQHHPSCTKESWNVLKQTVITFRVLRNAQSYSMYPGMHGIYSCAYLRVKAERYNVQCTCTSTCIYGFWRHIQSDIENCEGWLSPSGHSSGGRALTAYALSSILGSCWFSQFSKILIKPFHHVFSSKLLRLGVYRVLHILSLKAVVHYECLFLSLLLSFFLSFFFLVLCAVQDDC